MGARIAETAGRTRRGLVAPLTLALAVAGLALGGPIGCGGLGVEQYAEAAPRSSLELRFVAEGDRADAEAMPRLSGEGTVRLEPGAVLRAAHVAHVQLLDSGDGERLLVLQLREEGRARLREATEGADGRQLAIVAAGRVIATPSVRGVLDREEIAVRVERDRVDAAYAALHE